MTIKAAWEQMNSYQRRGLWSIPFVITIVAVMFWSPLGDGSATIWLNISMLSIWLIWTLVRSRVPLDRRG